MEKLVPIVVALFGVFIFLCFSGQLDAFLGLKTLVVTFRISTAMNVRTAVGTIRWIPFQLEISLLSSSVVTIDIHGFTFVTFVVVLTRKKGSKAIELLVDGCVQLRLLDSGCVRLAGDGKVSQDRYGVVKHDGASTGFWSGKLN